MRPPAAYSFTYWDALRQIVGEGWETPKFWVWVRVQKSVRVPRSDMRKLRSWGKSWQEFILYKPWVTQILRENELRFRLKHGEEEVWMEMSLKPGTRESRLRRELHAALEALSK